MGGINTKEKVISKLKKLDKKELELNIKLRDLQLKLNQMVPEEERVRVNEYLGLSSKEIRNMKKKNNNKKKNKKNKKGKKNKKKSDDDSYEEEFESESYNDDDNVDSY